MVSSPSHESIRPRRSVLYMPGSNVRALEKAKSLPADALILDLEDAVAPEAKEEARAQVCAAVRAGGYGHREIIIRINDPTTPTGAADLAQVAPLGADAVLVPKVETSEAIYVVSRRLTDQGAFDKTRLWVMVETPRAVLNLAEIAGASRGTRLEALVLGTNDLAKALLCAQVPGRAPLTAALSLSVMAARACGLSVLDGVFNDIQDEEGFVAECRQGAAFGFDGKTLIHPSQIAPCNRAFAPDPDEVSFARQVIAAFDAPENVGKGALKVAGRMVERLHAEQGRRLVALAEAIATRENGHG